MYWFRIWMYSLVCVGRKLTSFFCFSLIPSTILTFLHLPPEDTITGDAPNNTNNRTFGGRGVSSPAITLTEECRQSSSCQVKRAIDMLLPGNNDSPGIMWKLDCRTRDESLSLFLLSPRCYRACLCSQHRRACWNCQSKYSHTHSAKYRRANLCPRGGVGSSGF